MINQLEKNKIVEAIRNFKEIFGIVAIFVISAICQINFSLPLILVCLLAYIKFRRLGLKKYDLLHLLLLFLINLAVCSFVIKRGWQVYYIPFCVVPMVATLLFDNLEVSLLLTLASAFSAAVLSMNFFLIGFLVFISGVVSSILVLGARKRTTIIRAGLITGVLQLITAWCIYPYWLNSFARCVLFIVNGLACAIIVLGVLPVFEYLFKKVTNISLLELADFNHPLLQRLTLEAPGTYHHSLIVGNLSESACQAIGANSLLARIGAYYHDIGKVEKPEYFSENQNITGSKHDTLSPAMSKLIIMNHVKEGVELAKKYRLSPPLLDFIAQHHGSSLVYYFYRRALEGLEEDQEVREEGYRYPGPKPDTKETAIVLLADSVEAATRAMKEPSPAKIEELVHKIINNKFIDAQLDACELTLKDLEKISAVFIRILSGIYHARVTYPEETRSENNHNHKKSSKEDSRQSEEDKIDNS